MRRESPPALEMGHRLSLMLFVVVVLLALPSASRPQRTQPDQIDELLASTAPEIPADLQAVGASGAQDRDKRVSRRLESLFRTSPLAASGSAPAMPMEAGSPPPPVGAPTVPRAPPPVDVPAEPAAPADGLGQEQDGWSVSQGKQLTFYGSPSAAACRSDCAQRMDCVGYTWVKPGGYTAGDPPVCYLMSEIEALTTHPCCITATRFDPGAGANR